MNRAIPLLRPLAIILILQFIYVVHGRAQTNSGLAATRTFGTLIQAYGNSNGIVVVTDSMASYRDRQTNQILQIHDPAQKLIAYDPHTVCAIAGAGSELVPVEPEFNTSLLAVIALYRDQIYSRGIRESYESALNNLSSIIQFRITQLSNINERTGFSSSDQAANFELIMAGYDIDEKPKIGTLLLTFLHKQEIDRSYWEVDRHEINVAEVTGPGLRIAKGGMPDVLDDMIKFPGHYSMLEAVGIFADERHKNAAWTMPVDSLENFAKLAVTLTSFKFPEVGNGTQTAVLRGGKIAKFDQITFPPTRKPFTLVIMDRPVFFGGGFVNSVGNVVKFIDHGRFKNASSPPSPAGLVQLDGGIFVDCEFDNVDLYYDGGQAYFDPNNKIVNSRLSLGPNANNHPEIVQKLRRAFSQH
jgi:hypothetical protein